MNASYQVTEIQGIPWAPGIFFGLALLAAGVLIGYYYRDRTDPGEVEDAADIEVDGGMLQVHGDITERAAESIRTAFALHGEATWRPPLRWVANRSTIHYADCSKARKATPIEVWTAEAAAKWALAAKPPLKGCTYCHPFAQPVAVGAQP
jgi:hypothetical protein